MEAGVHAILPIKKVRMADVEWRDPPGRINYIATYGLIHQDLDSEFIACLFYRCEYLDLLKSPDNTIRITITSSLKDKV